VTDAENRRDNMKASDTHRSFFFHALTLRDTQGYDSDNGAEPPTPFGS
jgi:hypothetical protein